jgi:DNA modification methylase
MNQFLLISELVIEKGRQRGWFDPSRMEELKDSLERVGLMHPIVVEESNGRYTLVAGERRIRALVDIWDLGGTIRFQGKPIQEGWVPFTTLGELSNLESEEAQLDENLRRSNLTWQEHASAMARLERLRSAQAEESGTPAPSLESLAAEAFEPKREGFSSGASAYAKETVRKELVVEKYLDRPTVRGAKSLDEAYKVVIREEELARSEALGRSVGLTFTRADHTLLKGDCLELLPAMDPVFDVIITDPPYGMGADEFGSSGGRALPGEDIHMYSDDRSIIDSLVLPALEFSLQLTLPQAHAYVFCDLEGFFPLREFFRSKGWEPFRTPLIWVKPDGRVPLPQHGPRRTYEMLLYAFKGKRPTRHLGSDTLPFPPDTNLNLAAQKPVALFRELLARSCLPGNHALDPFCGTGTLLPAAHSLKVKATCIELDPKSYGIAVARLEKL